MAAEVSVVSQGDDVRALLGLDVGASDEEVVDMYVAEERKFRRIEAAFKIFRGTSEEEESNSVRIAFESTIEVVKTTRDTEELPENESEARDCLAKGRVSKGLALYAPIDCWRVFFQKGSEKLKSYRERVDYLYVSGREGGKFPGIPGRARYCVIKGKKAQIIDTAIAIQADLLSQLDDDTQSSSRKRSKTSEE